MHAGGGMSEAEKDPGARVAVHPLTGPAPLRFLRRTRAAFNRRVPPPWRRRIAVLVGGLLGTGLRVAVSALLPSPSGAWPWGTFAVNVAGAGALGYLLPRLESAATPTVTLVPLFCTGLLGAFTTFSTFCVETLGLAVRGRAVLAVAYAAASLGAGFPAAHVGSRIAEVRS